MKCAHLKKYPDQATAAAVQTDWHVTNRWPCSECNKWHVTRLPPQMTTFAQKPSESR